MRILGFVMGILMFSFFIANMVSIIGGTSQNYNVTNPINNSFNATFDKIQEMTTLTNQVNGLVNGSQVQSSGGIIDFFTTLSSGVYNSAKLILNSYKVVNLMISELSLQVGLPGYAISVLLTSILLGMCGWFLFAIFKTPA